MHQTNFEELKRYVCFGTLDEQALHSFLPLAAPSLGIIVERFYQRIEQHPQALQVFESPTQVQRLHGTLREWLELLLCGPWDEAYHAKRLRIGHTHVKVGLPQRYMFGAMNVVRGELLQLAESSGMESPQRLALQLAVNKLLDLELAIMLESYGEEHVARVQHVEREQRADLTRQLALSQARYDEIIEKAEALISTFDGPGRIVLFNAKCEQLTGVSRSEAHGRHWLELFVPESDRDLVARLQRQVAEGGAALSYEGTVPCNSQAARRVRWHFTTLPGGISPALCAIGIDVTTEHDLGLRTRRAERLAALGVMAAGLAHEIRNPLNSAHLQLDVARSRMRRPGRSSEGTVVRAIELAEVEMKRLANLVKDFLHFAKPQPLRLTLLDLRSSAQAAVELLAPEAKASGVKLQLVITREPVNVEADGERIKQVLLNLLRNALEATGPNGSVTLTVRHLADSGELMVEDDGPGWLPDAPIFEPFYTTKDSGTGLGLAIVHRIVMDHGGTLDANSRPGRSAFTVRFPQTYRSASPRA